MFFSVDAERSLGGSSLAGRVILALGSSNGAGSHGLCAPVPLCTDGSAGDEAGSTAFISPLTAFQD